MREVATSIPLWKNVLSDFGLETKRTKSKNLGAKMMKFVGELV
jgi:hypothetical protein